MIVAAMDTEMKAMSAFPALRASFLSGRLTNVSTVDEQLAAPSAFHLGDDAVNFPTLPAKFWRRSQEGNNHSRPCVTPSQGGVEDPPSSLTLLDVNLVRNRLDALWIATSQSLACSLQPWIHFCLLLSTNWHLPRNTAPLSSINIFAYKFPLPARISVMPL